MVVDDERQGRHVFLRCTWDRLGLEALVADGDVVGHLEGHQGDNAGEGFEDCFYQPFHQWRQGGVTASGHCSCQEEGVIRCRGEVGGGHEEVDKGEGVVVVIGRFECSATVSVSAMVEFFGTSVVTLVEEVSNDRTR